MASNHKKAVFTYRRNMDKAKIKVKEKGVRSIYDIISDKAMSLKNKISYIRHHYTYYDGNYDLFHNESGKPTQTKRMLDKVIYHIVKGEIDPSELGPINKEIVKSRKERDEQLRLIKEKEQEEIFKLLAKKEEVPEKPKPIEKAIFENKKGKNQTTDLYVNCIREYLKQLPKEERRRVQNWPYSDLKKIAKAWARNNCPSLLTSPEALEREEKKLREKGMEDLMKGYAKYSKKVWKNTI